MIQDAKWISCGKNCETPVIHKKFFLSNPQSVNIDISGLGYFELYINSHRVSNDYLVPAFSDYHARLFTKLTYPISDTLSHRIYYLHYDITPYIYSGENKIDIYLGNGWYRQFERIAEGNLSFGEELKAVFSFSILNEDGSEQVVLSDGTETYTPSYVTYSNLFIGEIQDARKLGVKEIPESVTAISSPATQLMLQTCPPDRIIRTVQPKLINLTEKSEIYDIGENISGWVRVRAKQKSGYEITLRFAEELNETGGLDFESSGSGCVCASGKKQVQTDTFICNGKDFVFEPKFVFHTFRYFEVTGKAVELTAVVLHSDIPVSSAFHCNNEALNWLYEAFIRTQLNNMHGGVPSDCPHRERLGYTGDGQIVSESAMLLLNSKSFYEKWIGDILDCQDINNGHVQHTAPFMGGGGGPGGWGCAIVMVPYHYYHNYGDTELLKECYPSMKKWVNYMKVHSKNYLVTSEEKDGWCLGDWAALDQMIIPEPYVNTCYFIKALKILSKITIILESPNEAEEYTDYIAKAKNAIIKCYYNPQTGSFCEGVQGADAFALDIDLCEDPRTITNLCKKYNDLGYFDTGFLGTDILVHVLFRYGFKDLAFDLLSNNKKGGYLWMKEHGATTIWEYFDGRCSHCHPIFGAPVQYLFHNLLGIKQSEDSSGFERIEIAPDIPKKLNYAFGKINTIKGEITVSWSKNAGKVDIFVSIPEKIKAILKFNNRQVALYAGNNRIAFPF